MKILHTADWHVGKRLRGLRRDAEHEAVLAEIVRLARDHSVDLVLVAGDQFDRAVPDARSTQLVYKTLVDLRDTGAEVVVIAGNHDNPGRWQALRPLLDLAGIHLGAHIARPSDGGLIELRSRAGETALAALLPFPSKRGIVKACDILDLESGGRQQKYQARVRAIVHRLCEGFRGDTVNLVLAHLSATGAQVGGGEREEQIRDYYVPTDIFPSAASYVALGHFHRQQKVAGRAPIWYGGSPFALDFGETERRHGVLLVKARVGYPAEVRHLPLASGRKLRILRGSREELLGMDRDEQGDDYLRVFVEDKLAPGLVDEVRERLPNAVDVIVQTPDGPGGGPQPPDVNKSPGELFREYLEDRGIEGEEMVRLFDELLEEERAAASA